MGAASAVAGEGARGTGETEQEELVRALRASRATAGAVGERLPWSVGALPGLAGARWQTARDRWDDPGTHGSAGALSGGVGASATLGAGFVGESAHSEAVREIESKAGGVYRSWMEGAEERAREAARRDGLSVYYHYRGEDWYRLKRSESEERMEQVRQIDGEQAYEKMRRAMERARQVERSSKLPVRKRPERRGPERGGPERDYGPSR